MKKKSGLADSPFFTPPEQQMNEPSEELVFFRPQNDEAKEKIGEGNNAGENVRKRTSGHVHMRTRGHVDKRTSGHSAPCIHLFHVSYIQYLQFILQMHATVAAHGQRRYPKG